ncbi:hypothetical protein D3C87_1409640 [compost metagenome]
MAHGQHMFEPGHLAYGREIIHRIVFHRRYGQRQGRHHVAVGHQQHGSVLGRRQEGLRRDLPAGAGAIFHHHGKLQGLAQFVGIDAGHGIRRAARRIADHDPDGPFERLGGVGS